MKIVVLPGDGIGPEVTAQAVKVLEAAASAYNFGLEFEEALIGGAAIEATGGPLPQATLDKCRGAAAVLLGAVGGPAWDNLPGDKRPEAGLLGIRKELGLFANIRPARVYPGLTSLSCLKPELVAGGLDFVVVRELTGDVYFGQPAGQEVRGGRRCGFSNMIYFEDEVRRIARVGFELALSRGRRLCSVDKANVLEVSRLWRAVVLEVARDYPDVALSHMYVDNAAMQIILNPRQFDVIVTGNIFGDILSDEAAAVSGSLGLLPSASLAESGGGNTFGLYEPVHGSAPDIAGEDKANPIACIMSAAMLLRTSLNQAAAAEAVELAVREVLGEGVRTGDLAGSEGARRLAGCREMGSLIAARLG